MTHDHAEQVKLAGDVVAGAGVFATLAGWLPPVAAAVTLIYTLVRLWETKTVQKLVARLCPLK